MGFWKTFLACLLAIFVSSILSFFISLMIFTSVVVGIFSSVETKATAVSEQSVLRIDLNDPIVEQITSNPMDLIDFSTMSVAHQLSAYDVVRMIDRAAIEPRVKGVYIKMPLVPKVSAGVMYELRVALENFRATAPDKFVITYADSYTQGGVYLSSVSSEVWLNPSGGVLWKGMAMVPMFYKGALDKLGVEPEIIRHGKFKGAVEPFILNNLSAENRLQMESVSNSMWDYLLAAIGKSRSINVAKLDSAATNLSIVTAADALSAGLVDKIYYADQAEGALKTLVGIDSDKDLNFMSLREYFAAGTLRIAKQSDNRIALIYAVGEIVDNGDGQDKIIGSKLAEKIAEARLDDDIKAIVLRVNSPGGSALASDLIWREMELAKSEKTVVVSMGDYAASGGYWISAPAHKIVSSPMTLTGSIGVFGLAFNAQKGFREHLGITFDPVVSNPSADMYSMVRPLTPLERNYIQSSVDTIYNNFLVKVSSGRHLGTDSVDMIGQGRIWTGLQGLDNGLVDKIGTLADAIELAAVNAGVDSDYTVDIVGEKEVGFLSILSQLSTSAIGKVLGFMSDPASVVLQELQAAQGQVYARIPYQIINQ